MRPQSQLRARRAMMALGASCLAYIPASALAPAAAQTTPDGASLSADVQDRSLRYGQKAVVRGRTEPRTPVTLEYLAHGGAHWIAVDTDDADAKGRYRLSTRLSRTGLVRVATGTGEQVRTAAAGQRPATRTPQRSVRVAAHLSASDERLDVRKGRVAWVGGAVRRPVEGRVVRLQRRAGKGWKTIDRDRTDSRGRYRLSYDTRRAGSHRVRVRFSGDELNAPASKGVGRLNVYRRSFASWYGPGFYGNRTACGRTLTGSVMGVAHKTLPCGTKLTLKKGSRTARVTVIDRGPFHAGREFDLAPAVKRKLRFGSTGTVYTTSR